MNRTKIEYLTHTWNPIAMRCSRVSEGCRRCWHLSMADRLAQNPTMSDDRRQAYGIPLFYKQGPGDHQYYGKTPFVDACDHLEYPIHMRRS